MPRYRRKVSSKPAKAPTFHKQVPRIKAPARQADQLKNRRLPLSLMRICSEFDLGPLGIEEERL